MMIFALLACTGAPSGPKSELPILAPPPESSAPPGPRVPAPAPTPADPATTTAFAFLGDTGKGTPGQKRTADALIAWCKSHRCDLVAYLGDNLYPEGAQTADDPIFKEKFEDYWVGLEVPFWVALGNHDHYGKVQAELDYAKKQTKWRQPAAWYSFSAGVADFFVVDSGGEEEGVVPADQLVWLAEKTKASTAPWKIAYGHHPIHSSGLHGDGPAMVKDFEPALRADGVQFWLCGHDHDMEVLDDGVAPVEIVSGGGGDLRKVNPAQPTSKYLASSNGFGYLELTPSQATLTMVEVDEGGVAKTGYTQVWTR